MIRLTDEPLFEKPLLLPQTDDEGHPYLSYSQISKWKKSKREYIRKYFMGEPDDNEALQRYGDFGHKVGEALEHNNYEAFEEDEIEFLKTVPRYDRFECTVGLVMDGFYVKGYIDTLKLPDDHVKGSVVKHVPAIADYKTGDIEKKGSSMIDYSSKEYNQLEIYAAHVEQTFGNIPEAYVFLIGRSGNAFAGEELKLTKELLIIDRELTKEKVDAVKADVQQIAEEISEYYQAYLKLNKIL
jgi:hypothetical protein